MPRGQVNIGWHIASLVDVALDLWSSGGAAGCRFLYVLLHPGTERPKPIHSDDLFAVMPLLARAVATWPQGP